jgi:hypothetical protein
MLFDVPEITAHLISIHTVFRENSVSTESFVSESCPPPVPPSFSSIYLKILHSPHITTSSDVIKSASTIQCTPKTKAFKRTLTPENAYTGDTEPMQVDRGGSSSPGHGDFTQTYKEVRSSSVVIETAEPMRRMRRKPIPRAMEEKNRRVKRCGGSSIQSTEG